MGLGFYVGSRDGGYANHLFSDSNSRIPANEVVMNVNSIFKKGQLRNFERSGVFDSKIYSFVESPQTDICTVFPDAKNFEFLMNADAATSGEPVSVTARIDCSAGGTSPLFLKYFCNAPVEFFREDYAYENTKFSFAEIIDGFPSEWSIVNLNVEFRDGLNLSGIKPSQSATALDFSINCKSF